MSQLNDLDPATVTVIVTALTGLGGALGGILRELIKSRQAIEASPLGLGLKALEEKFDTLSGVVLRHIATEHQGDVWPAEAPATNPNGIRRRPGR